jgi:hypothetical protein
LKSSIVQSYADDAYSDAKAVSQTVAADVAETDVVLHQLLWINTDRKAGDSSSQVSLVRSLAQFNIEQRMRYEKYTLSKRQQEEAFAKKYPKEINPHATMFTPTDSQLHTVMRTKVEDMKPLSNGQKDGQDARQDALLAVIKYYKGVIEGTQQNSPERKAAEQKLAAIQMKQNAFLDLKSRIDVDDLPAAYPCAARDKWRMLGCTMSISRLYQCDSRQIRQPDQQMPVRTLMTVYATGVVQMTNIWPFTHMKEGSHLYIIYLTGKRNANKYLDQTDPGPVIGWPYATPTPVRWGKTPETNLFAEELIAMGSVDPSGDSTYIPVGFDYIGQVQDMRGKPPPTDGDVAAAIGLNTNNLIDANVMHIRLPTITVHLPF